MSSRFLRQSIATLLSLGALWGTAHVSAAAASSGVEVTCHNFSCVPEDPWGPWGPGGGGGGGGDWDTSGGGGVTAVAVQSPNAHSPREEIVCCPA